MLYGDNQTIEDSVVELLVQESMTAKKLLAEIKKDGEDFSIQAVFYYNSSTNELS